MKKIISNKLFLFFMAFISLFCSMLGFINTPKSVLADNNQSEYSTWNKTALNIGDNLVGKYLAIYDPSSICDVIFTFGDSSDPDAEFCQIYFYFSEGRFDINCCPGNSAHSLEAINKSTYSVDGFYLFKFEPIMCPTHGNYEFTSFIVDSFTLVNNGDTYYENTLPFFYFLEEPVENNEVVDKLKDTSDSPINPFFTVLSSLFGVVILVVVVSLLTRKSNKRKRKQ